MIKELTQWDGKSNEVVTKIYEQYKSSQNFAQELIDLCSNAKTVKGATWLIKHHFESEGQFTQIQQNQFLKLLIQFEHWESILHSLQILPYITISQSHKSKLEKFIHSNLTHKNTFVRAWSYNGDYVLANQYPEFMDNACTFFKLALNDEAASVKARIRQIVKRDKKLAGDLNL